MKPVLLGAGLFTVGLIGLCLFAQPSLESDYHQVIAHLCETHPALDNESEVCRQYAEMQRIKDKMEEAKRHQLTAYRMTAGPVEDSAAAMRAHIADCREKSKKMRAEASAQLAAFKAEHCPQLRP